MTEVTRKLLGKYIKVTITYNESNKVHTQNDTNKIDLGTKVIFKYPSPTKIFDIGRMVVNGRNPEGKIYAGDDVFDVKINDVVLVPKGNKFAAEGKMEYITVDVPAFYLEQSTEIEG